MAGKIPLVLLFLLVVSLVSSLDYVNIGDDTGSCSDLSPVINVFVGNGSGNGTSYLAGTCMTLTGGDTFNANLTCINETLNITGGGDGNYSNFANVSFWWNNYETASDLNGLVLSYWLNITDRPTNLSEFTDDLDYSIKNVNYSDTCGVCSSSNFVEWADVNNSPTNLTQFTDDIDYSTKNVNSSDFWDDLNTPSDLTNLVLSDWTNISNVPVNLSQFFDNLGNRGYTHLSNFTDDINYSNINVNSSNSTTFWDGETSQADLNVNHSNSCTALDTPETSDETFINKLLTVYTFNSSYANSNLDPVVCGMADESLVMNWTGLYNYPVACPANNFMTQVGDTITCTSVQEVPLSLLVDNNLTVLGNFTMGSGNVTLSYNTTCNILYSPGGGSQLRLCD